MACISGKYGESGLIVQVAVFADAAAMRHSLSFTSAENPQTTFALYDALIDTGATATCISQKVVDEVGLRSMGKCQMISASHVADVNEYVFVIGRPLEFARPADRGAESGFAIFENVSGLEFAPSGAPIEILIGMDIVQQGSLKLDFDGHFSFRF